MDEFITFIIIWVVLYLINQFTKKFKKLETGKPGQVKPPVTQTKPSPPFWETPPQEFAPPTSLPLDGEEFEEEQEFQESEEVETKQDFRENLLKKIEDIEPLPSEIKKAPEVVPSESVDIPKLSLKQYVIWKEILDKPVSLREKGQRILNRVS